MYREFPCNHQPLSPKVGALCNYSYTMKLTLVQFTKPLQPSQGIYALVCKSASVCACVHFMSCVVSCNYHHNQYIQLFYHHIPGTFSVIGT